MISRDHLLAQGRGSATASQSTQIEQSRAVAQVQGALVVASQNPRDVKAAANRMRAACEIEGLASRAFFSIPRGGSAVTGASIHLARELGRCWGNVDYGIAELRRDDEKGESEMLAYAWDLESNVRVTSAFIVPHRRDVKGGQKPLTDLRDIYENNANAGARRLRQCIFAVIPIYLITEAEDLCRKTLEHGGGRPIEQRREKLLEAFAGIGVTREQIENRTGHRVGSLSVVDIANLGIVYSSIRNGETTAREQFEDDSADKVRKEISSQGRKPGGSTPAERDPEPRPVAPTESANQSSEPAPEPAVQLHLPNVADPIATTPGEAINVIADTLNRTPDKHRQDALDTIIRQNGWLMASPAGISGVAKGLDLRIGEAAP